MRSRGSATVELALSMLLIVPLILYALFLSDLLSYRLDQQEAVTSTLWDFTVQNYEKPLPRAGGADPEGEESQGGGGGAAQSPLLVQRHARLNYCDHESGVNRYDKMSGASYSDCSGTDHHEAMTAHQCWLNGNAKQITCSEPDVSVGLTSDPAQKAIGKAIYPNGGLISCSGREIVENYLLPKTFLQEFSHTDLTKEQWAGDVHANSRRGDSATAYYFEEDRFALLTDPWALNTIQEVKVDGGGGSGNSQLIKDGLKKAYQTNLFYPISLATSTSFTVGLISDEVLGPTEMFNTVKTVFKPSAAVSKGLSPEAPVKQEGGSKKYFASTWKDWDQNPVEKTHEARGQYYLGCKQPEDC